MRAIAVSGTCAGGCAAELPAAAEAVTPAPGAASEADAFPPLAPCVGEPAVEAAPAPEAETEICPSASGPSLNSGLTSRTTRYWLVWVKIVETSLCPNAL